MKPTISEQLEASAIVRRLIENFGEKHSSEVSDGVATELNRIYARLLKADERLLQPKTPQPRKPKAPDTLLDGTVSVKLPTAHKATFEPDDTYVNSKPKTGRNRP